MGAVAKAETKPGRFVELGATGLKRMSGTIDEEFLPDLRRKKGRQTFREMSENEPIVGACISTIKQFARSVTVWVEDAQVDDARAKEAGDLVRTALTDMSSTWNDLLSEILSMLIYGWSGFELVYKVRGGDVADPAKRSKYADGLIGWRKIPIRAQESLDRWDFDEAGGVKALVQRPAPAYQEITIPIDKLLLFKTEAYRGSPEGRSLLRSAYLPWYHLKHTRFIEGVGIERDLVGYPVLRAPASVVDSNAAGDKAAVRTELLNIGHNLRRDEQEFVLLPSDRDESGNYAYDLTLIASSGSRQFDIDKTIQRLQREIALALLCDFVLLGHEKVGSFALASSKTAVFSLALAGWLDAILSVFNNFAIPRLITLNGWQIDVAPTLTRGDIETPDLVELGDYVSKLAGAGMVLFPNNELENRLLAAANLPTTEDVEVD